MHFLECVYVHYGHEQFPSGPKRASEHLDLRLRLAVSLNMGVENPTHVLSQVFLTFLVNGVQNKSVEKQNKLFM